MLHDRSLGGCLIIARMGLGQIVGMLLALCRINVVVFRALYVVLIAREVDKVSSVFEGEWRWECTSGSKGHINSAMCLCDGRTMS